MIPRKPRRKKGKLARSRASYRYRVHIATQINKPIGSGQIDHIVPVSFGFIHNISPALIGSRENLQIMEPNANIQKGQTITPEAVRILRKWGESDPRIADLADAREIKMEMGR